MFYKVYGDENGIEPIKVMPHLKAISLAFMLDKDAPVIWRGPLKMTAIKQFIGDVKWGKLDFLVVALLDSRRAVNFALRLGMNVLGIIENMSGFKCPYCGKEINLFKIGGGEQASKELGIDFLGRLPIDEKIVIGGDAGIPFVKENSIAKKAFIEIVEKVLRKLNE